MANPIYTYSTNVPQAAQIIDITQKPIESNFLAINEWINKNHVGFSDSVNYGKHNFTNLYFQNSDPSTSATEMALYSKATPGGPNAGELFYRYPSNGTVVQLTGGGTGSSSSTTTLTGYSNLPGGLMMKWGTATGIVPGSNVITFPTGAGAIPAFTTEVMSLTYSVSPVSYTESAPCPYISNITLTNFTFTVPNTFSSAVNWLAIGM